MQRNFILTDVMKTGFHVDLEDFINLHSLNNQTFDMTGEYYTLHGYDLDSYDRKFAIIDWRYDNSRLANNHEYKEELDRRIKLLHSQGFLFIKSNPWESNENLNEMQSYPEVELNHMKWTGDVSWFWFFMHRKHINKTYKFSHDKKHLDFLYLNKQERTHRKKLYNKVKPLLENSLYTYWAHNIKLSKDYELPWAQDYPVIGLDQDLYEKPYNDTKFSLISETNDNNHEIFMTEKIWKPIIAKHLFVVHGNHLYLQKLREIGFKTFSAYYDESYDLEADKDVRIEKIYNVCKDLKQKNWQDLYLQTQNIREHNYRTFFDKDKLGLQVNKTLNLFLEFADGSQITS